jgi:outer membrane protein TolC
MIACLVLVAPRALAAEPLTLAEAERIAVERDVGRTALGGEAESLRAMAVASGQLPDPEARVGAVNVPTDSFDLEREDMTMLEVGIMQRFPPGHTRRLARERYERLAEGRDAESLDRERMVRLEVRRAWHELRYTEAALDIVQQEGRWLDAMVGAATSAYAAGEGGQTALLKARLEVLEVRERLTDLERDRGMRLAELERWLGDAAGRPRTDDGAQPPLKPLAELESLVLSHPQLAAGSAEMHAAQSDAELARQKYRPGFGFDVAYGYRQGRDMAGEPRSDMLTAMLTFDVPLFTRDRQDREVAAAHAMARTAEARRADRERELLTRLRTAHANVLRQTGILALYREQGSLLAGVTHESALAAFRSGQGELGDVIDTHHRALAVRTRLARAEADIAISRAEIDYLTGDLP